MKLAYLIFSRFNRTIPGRLKFDGGSNGSFDPNQTPTGGPGFNNVPASEQSDSKAFAITALVTGIVSLVFNCCSCGGCTILAIPEILAVIAIVFAVLDKKKLRSFRGIAITGLVCAILSLLISVAIIFLMTSPYYQEQKAAIESMVESILAAESIKP